MRKLLKWIIVSVGITAFVRWFKRRGGEPEVTAPPEPEVTAPPEPADDPADELRRKLAESREAVETGEPEVAATGPEASVEERRADVHQQGRAALDEMNSADEG